MTDLQSHLVQCFQAVFPDLSEEEIKRASLASVADWDSVAGVSLISVLEEEFEIEIAPEDMEILVSFALIEDYLRREKGAA